MMATQLFRTDSAQVVYRVFSIVGFGLIISISSRVAGGDVLPGQIDQFADTSITLRLSIPNDVVANASAFAWQLSTNHRTLARGKSRLKRAADLNVEGNQKTQSVSSESIWLLEISTPKANHGVVLESILSFQLPGDESLTNVPIRLHHRDPMESIRQTLSTEDVAVVDSIGSTRAAFETISWQPRHAVSLDQVKNAAIVILGESIKWDAALIATAELMATQGTKFIVLKPEAQSHWPVSLEPIRTKHFELLRSIPTGPGATALDDLFWHQPPKTAPGWKLSGADESLQIEPLPGRTNDGIAGWQLIRVQVGEHGGGFLFVGLNIIERFDQSPVPRETFKMLLLGCMKDSEKNSPSEIFSQSR